MADLAEIMAQLKETRGYIYILSLPGVPEIVKIIGRKEGFTDSEVEAQEKHFVVESKHSMDFYENALKWIYVNMSRDCLSYNEGLFKTSVRDAQYVIMIKTKPIGNVSPQMEALTKQLAEINKAMNSDVIKRIEYAIKNSNKAD